MGLLNNKKFYNFSNEEIQNVKNEFPNLNLVEPGIWKGILDFDMIYREYRIADSYEISIHVHEGFPESLPSVFETNGRVSAIVEKNNLVSELDAHYNSYVGACLCVRQEQRERLPDGSDLIFFIKTLVIPYFFGLSHLNEQGRWPWKEYSHGGLGILEHYIENWRTPTEEEIRYLAYVFSLDLYKERYRKQLRTPNPNCECLCGSKKPFSKCHTKAWEGLVRLNLDLKILKINSYKLI